MTPQVTEGGQFLLGSQGSLGTMISGPNNEELQAVSYKCVSVIPAGGNK